MLNIRSSARLLLPVLGLLFLYELGHAQRVSSEYQEMETTLLQLVNQHRKEQGASPLQMNDYLSALAREHNQKMATGKRRFSHDGFSQRADLIWEKMEGGRAAENVSKGFKWTPGQVLQGWKVSGAHLDNLENPAFTLTGIGVAKGPDGVYYFTQIFLEK